MVIEFWVAKLFWPRSVMALHTEALMLLNTAVEQNPLGLSAPAAGRPGLYATHLSPVTACSPLGPHGASVIPARRKGTDLPAWNNLLSSMESRVITLTTKAKTVLPIILAEIKSDVKVLRVQLQGDALHVGCFVMGMMTVETSRMKKTAKKCLKNVTRRWSSTGE